MRRAVPGALLVLFFGVGAIFDGHPAAAVGAKARKLEVDAKTLADATDRFALSHREYWAVSGAPGSLEERRVALEALFATHRLWGSAAAFHLLASDSFVPAPSVEISYEIVVRDAREALAAVALVLEHCDAASHDRSDIDVYGPDNLKRSSERIETSLEALEQTRPRWAGH